MFSKAVNKPLSLLSLGTDSALHLFQGEDKTTTEGCLGTVTPDVCVFLLQTLLSTVERDLATLQEVSEHHKKRSAEILSMLLRDLNEIGTVIGTSDHKTVQISDMIYSHP